jgi:hypothetical protein
MKLPSFLAVVFALLLTTCHHVQPPDACAQLAKRPLLPRIHLDEPGPPGYLVVLVLDAATGQPVSGAHLRLAPTNRVAMSDSTGHARLSEIAAGSYETFVRAIGYKPQRDSVVLREGEGRVRVAQLIYEPCVLEEIRH